MFQMIRRILPLLLFLTAPILLPAQDAARAGLDAHEQKLEQLWADYWRAQYAIDAGDSNSSVQEIRRQINAVLTDQAFLRQLRRAHWSDPVLRRRRELFLSDATDALIDGDPSLVKAVEETTKVENDFRFNVGGKQMTRAEVNNILGHSPDRELRRQAWLAQQQLTAKTGEPIRNAMILRLRLARAHGVPDYSAFMLRRKGLRHRKQILDWFEQIRAATELEYDQLLGRMQNELKLDHVEPWDLEYYFSTLTGDFEKKAFPPDQAWAKTKKVSALLGIDYDSLPVKLRIADITFGGGTYPILYGKEVRILANKYEGLRFTDTVMHESGHGLHYTFSNEPSFLLNSELEEPFDEGLGQVISLMLYRPQVATGIFGLSETQARQIAERYRLQTLYDLRSTMADSIFELTMYANPKQDPARLYAETSSLYLSMPIRDGRNWAYNPFYGSGPIYLQSYVVAEMVGRQIHHALDVKFGPTWDAHTGAFLKEKFFSRGALYSVDEVMRQGTGEALTPKYLIDALQPPHPTPP